MTLTQHLQQTFIEEHPLEAARYLEELPSLATGDLLKTMDPERVASLLEYFLPGPAANILQQYPPATSAKILNQLSDSSARAVLRQFDTSTRESLLEHLDPLRTAFFRRTINLPEQAAGSLADPRVLTLPPDITAGHALHRIAQAAHQAMYYLYIIDNRNRLAGVVLMKELLAAETTSPLGSMMNTDVKVIPASAYAQDVMLHPAWAHYDSLPVIDSDKTFIGALRHRTLRKFLQGRPDDPKSEYLSDALLQLWEAYSLSGIGLMTALGEVLEASTAKQRSQEQQEMP